jgi:hypothetical protein
MLKCDKCGADIPEGSNFCPNCADAVTEADLIKELPPKPSAEKHQAAESKRIYFVCPKCFATFRLAVTMSESNLGEACPACHSMFNSKLVQVKSKTSRGDKKENQRLFSVSVVDMAGRESAVEFTNAKYRDFELRENDIALFTYFSGELRIVQNMTTGKYMRVTKPQCYLAGYVYGPDSAEVRLLRAFRDGVLIRSRLLTGLVRLYYRLSPWLIRRFGGRRAFRTAARAMVDPIVRLCGWFARNGRTAGGEE